MAFIGKKLKIYFKKCNFPPLLFFKRKGFFMKNISIENNESKKKIINFQEENNQMILKKIN